MKLDRIDGIPLYVQVREQLREELAMMQPGQPIPIEAELEKKFGASRITIRRAVEELAAEGLLVRQQGRGTFVQRPKLTHELSQITSWTEQLKILGFSPRTAHRKLSRGPAPGYVTEALRLTSHEEVVRLQRVRLAGREPISYMTNYLPARLVPGLTAAKFSGESLYELLERDYELVPGMAVDTVSTRRASEEEARALRIERDAPILSVRRISYMEDGTPLELAVVASRGDRYQYEVTLQRRPMNIRPPDHQRSRHKWAPLWRWSDSRVFRGGLACDLGDESDYPISNVPRSSADDADAKCRSQW
jgi:GntR family transcriptional regulator